MEERYINPHTDFGFKRLFGSEFNKELLISFLNALFHGEQVVKDVTYLQGESLGERTLARSAVFDVCCTNEKGEKFLVEMQNVYYSIFPHREQTVKEKWKFQPQAIYFIGLLNFNFAEGLDEAHHWHHGLKIVEMDTRNECYDKLTYVYVEIPKFDKEVSQLVTMFDKWMFVLKNLPHLMARPAALQEGVFIRLFEQSEIPKHSSTELTGLPTDLLRQLA